MVDVGYEMVIKEPSWWSRQERASVARFKALVLYFTQNSNPNSLLIERCWDVVIKFCSKKYMRLKWSV